MICRRLLNNNASELGSTGMKTRRTEVANEIANFEIKPSFPVCHQWRHAADVKMESQVHEANSVCSGITNRHLRLQCKNDFARTLVWNH